MDLTDIEKLCGIFNLAPTVELAEVICDQMMELDSEDQILDFLQDARVKLSDAQNAQLAELFFDKKRHDLIPRLLDEGVVEHAHMLIKSIQASGDVDGAKNKYLELVAQNSDYKIAEIDRLLEINTEKDAKVRLKVVEKADIASITDLQQYHQKPTDFSDVVGLTEIKKQIHKKIILPFQKPSLFQRFKKKVGGGVLLFGPPGCGKTLLARATAGECNASFYNIELSDVLDMYIGESEQKLHAIFEKARAESPCVLFFDEFEAMASKRESQRNTSYNNLVSQFLTELDGFSQNNSGVLVLASTNVPWSVDSAFLRPGRFDRMFFVPPPDKAARQGILQHHMQDRPAEQNINYATLAEKCRGYSGADLYNLVEMAADEAIDESIETNNDVLIGARHFKEAVSVSNSTTIEWLTTARNYARYANDGGRYNDVLKFIQKHGK